MLRSIAPSQHAPSLRRLATPRPRQIATDALPSDPIGIGMLDGRWSPTNLDDFIEVFPLALAVDTYTQLTRRFERGGEHVPGRVGGGVIPELKRSRDLQISGKQAWRDAEQLLNDAMLASLLKYLRKYPHTMLAPLMLQIPDPESGVARRLTAEDVTAMADDRLAAMIRLCFRPGAINIQRYTADEGGYPYWHCEHYPQDGSGEALHRTLLWTAYLNEGFDGGETEFLYQQRKIVPRTGSLLIAPAGFTHTHRGNRPSGGDKYIATSWVLFQRAEQLFAAAAG